MANLTSPEAYALICNAAAPASIFISLSLVLINLFASEHKTRAAFYGRRQQICSRFSLAICALLFIDVGVATAQSLSGGHDALYLDRLFFTLSSALVWLCLTFVVVDAEAPSRLPFLAFWALYIVSDTCLLAINDGSTIGGVWVACHGMNQGLRATLNILMVVQSLRSSNKKGHASLPSEETEPLIPDDESDDSEYGTVESEGGFSHTVAAGQGDDEDDDEDEREIKELQNKRLAEQGGWLGYLKGFAIFLPHIIPYHDRVAQAWVLVILGAVTVTRILTVLTPRQLGIITEELGNVGETGQLPWKQLLIWGLLKFPLSHGAEFTYEFAQLRVSQFAYKQLRGAAFSHVMSLSMDYHSQKSSGKLTKAIEQGTDLTTIIDNMFLIVPTFIDLIIATVYLTTSFDRFMGLIVISSTTLYILISIRFNIMTSHMERVFSERQRTESEVLYDSVTNWQLVTYNNRRRFEEERYAKSVHKSVMAQRQYFVWTDIAFFLQNSNMDIGLVIAALYAAHKMVYEGAPLSSFVFLVSYWSSVKEPMWTIAHTFHETAAHVINAEWLFQLLQTKASIKDAENAKSLDINDGTVEFHNVAFSYDPERPILKEVNITVGAGQTIALVGETGGGKSTILKLLYRFYDATSGSILIDGQDIRSVTLDSLRDSLGIVPQDPSVFDQTILQNILYARPHATIEEVHAAARSARIHDQILSFPKGYNTRIGERGVRLSGGELQRLAIARVILRRPKIVVLDEATSAVDSATEVLVQEALAELSKGRTMFVVAHRLSTIVRADKIVVLKGGEIVEGGRHEELLAKDGAYAKLWGMQTRGSI